MVLCTVDRHPDQPRLAVLLAVELALLSEICQEGLREHVIRVREIRRVPDRDLIDHIRVSPYHEVLTRIKHPCIHGPVSLLPDFF